MKQAILDIIDKKIEQSEQRSNMFNGENFKNIEKQVQINFQELRQEIENLSEWIDVTEKLPVKEGEYLVFSASGKIRIAKFQRAINFDNDAYFYIDNLNPKKTENSYIPIGPKSWMPLPPHPSSHE